MKELKPIHNSQKSFYRKAFVTQLGERTMLHSYDTLAVTISQNQNVFLHISYEDVTASTMKHIREFLLQEGYEAGSKKEIYKKYHYGFYPVDFYSVNNDVYGNPRYVVDFTHFACGDYTLSIDAGFKMALTNAKKVGGSKYRGKDFGGGIVLQSYNKATTELDINKARLGLI